MVKNASARALLALSLSLPLVACSSPSNANDFVREPSEPVYQPEPVRETAAVVRREATSASGNRDYWIGKKKYKIWRGKRQYRQEGRASWVAQSLDGNPTASGETMDSRLFSAAHRHLPLPSYVRVTNLDNGRETIVRVNDRGPFVDDRIIDLSHAAAEQLDMLDSGTAAVRLELVHAEDDSDTALAAEQVQELPTFDEQPYRAPARPDSGRSERRVHAATSAHPVAVPVAADGEGHMIQILASQSHDRAYALGEVMARRHGLPYKVEHKGHLYHVLMGPVHPAQQPNFLTRLRDEGIAGAFVVR
ncbi:MAG: septal ring lytic transglycosylase RlpA family protein [Aeromonas sp.]